MFVFFLVPYGSGSYQPWVTSFGWCQENWLGSPFGKLRVSDLEAPGGRGGFVASSGGWGPGGAGSRAAGDRPTEPVSLIQSELIWGKLADGEL